MKKYASILVVLYSVGLVLIPPIQWHGRYIFSAEYLLLPILGLFLYQALRGDVGLPPRSLICVWVVGSICFLLGSQRGDLALRISIYDLKDASYFSWTDDGLVFLRYMVLLSTPWFVQETFRRDVAIKELFLRVLKGSLCLSVVLAILDYKPIHIIDLGKWGYYYDYGWWRHRAHGTFVTPIEASFLYGGACTLLLTQYGVQLRDLRRHSLDLVTLVLCAVGLILTQGATAILALILSCGLFYINKTGWGWKKLAALSGGFATAFVVALYVLPKEFIRLKTVDFIYRQKTYFNLWHLLPDHPSLLLKGLGFSRICADNNYILLVIQGGLPFLAVVLWYLWGQAKRLNLSERSLIIFWTITWLSFDAMGYWGIGRLSFFLLGL